jgi:hypothetical protein
MDSTPDLIVTLGDFKFIESEIPQKITFGGAQKLVIHRMVGGARQIDSMGNDPVPVEWSGLFLGPNALDRARYLDNLRAAGRQLTFACGQLNYTVKIASFTADFLRYYRIPFSIRLEPIADNTAFLGKQSLQSLTDAMSADADNAVLQAQKAQDYLAGSGNPDMIAKSASITQKTTGIKALIQGVSNFAKATQDQIAKILTPINDVRQDTKVLLASVNNTLVNVTTLGGVLPNNPIAQQTAKMLQEVNTANSQPALLQLDSVLGRMSGNLENANAGPKTVTLAGGNLMDVAVAQYGDVNGWTTIARANNMIDPEFTGIKTLVIPPTPDGSGGVLNA